MKNFVKYLLVLTSIIFLVACQKDETKPVTGDSSSEGVEEMTIKFAHVVAENTPKHKGALKMKEYIEKESGGKIEVEIYPNSSLFGDQDEYQNLVANNIQFIAPDLTKFVGNNPQFNVPALPFMFDDDDEAIAFWDGEKVRKF